MKVKMYETVGRTGDYHLRVPLSGGKAGKGHAKTSNVQVFDSMERMIVKRFSFKVNDFVSKKKAVDEASFFVAKRLLDENAN